MASGLGNHESMRQAVMLDGWLGAWMHKRAMNMNEKLTLAVDGAGMEGLSSRPWQIHRTASHTGQTVFGLVYREGGLRGTQSHR